MRSLAAALAALLLLSSVVGLSVADPVAGDSASPAADGTPAITPAPEATDGATDAGQLGGGAPRQIANGTDRYRVLDLQSGSVTGNSIDRATIDLGPSLGLDSNSTAARLRTLEMVERVEAADGDTRQRFILGELNRIEQGVITLQSRQRAAITSYGDGDISGKQLLIRLAQIDETAEELERRRAQLSALAADTEDFAVDQSRLAAVERELDTFSGPVRTYAVRVLAGDAPPTRFAIATGENSVVLTAIRGERLIREAYRGDRRRRTGNSMDPETALNITAESYPSIWDRTRNSTEVVGSGDSFRVSVSHASGTLTAFIDSGSGDVFKEFQTRQVDSMYLGPTRTNVRDDLRLTVNRSYAGAPFQVRLTSASTGGPVDANITVGLAEEERSDFVGRTGTDGVLRTLTPREAFTVTAIRGNAVVIVRVDPAPVPRVYADDADANETGTGSLTPGE